MTCAIPSREISIEKFHFFLDTHGAEIYTFVNCSIYVADFDVDIEQGRIDKMATKKAVAKKPAKKAAKKTAKKK
jgi:hypothetical protein